MQEIILLLLSGLLKFAVIPLLGFCLLQSLVNRRIFRRLRPRPTVSEEKDFQDVSVLVPARNEERRIRDCLASLIAQEPPVREIILLDDRSEDATGQIARELGFCEEAALDVSKLPKLRIIRGVELPEGWVGKNWACHQLSLAADPKSHHLLFTDADTIHGPACLRTALSHAKAERLDLLSLWPDQITGTWSEKLVIPLGYFLLMALQPLLMLVWLQADPRRVGQWRVSRERLASMGSANGQFLLFRRTAYESLGGHEALKDHLVEDIAFGRRVAARTGEGMRLANADGIELLRCRMYSGFDELWEGFSKNMRPVFEESHNGFFLSGVFLLTVFLLPFGTLLLSPFYGILYYPSLIAVALILITRLYYV